MTLPPSIRVNTQVPFPALVQGSGPIAISKQNGIWTVSLNLAAVAKTTIIADPTNTYVLAWNSVTGVFTTVQVGAVTNASKTIKTLAAGNNPYAALPGDDVLLVNSVPFTVTIDWSQRTKPLRIVDITGNATVANPITITPGAGQSQLAQVNYSYTIDGAGGSITLTPLPDNSGAY